MNNDLSDPDLDPDLLNFFNENPGIFNPGIFNPGINPGINPGMFKRNFEEDVEEDFDELAGFNDKDFAMAMAVTEEVNLGNEHEDNIYYKKKIREGDTTEKMWNILYGEGGILYQLDKLPFSIREFDGTYLYLPKLGNAVPNEKCKEACMEAQQRLKDIGYIHIDLYNKVDDFYNCTNVREIDGEYYPIDMMKIEKIMKSEKGGKRTRKKSRKRRLKIDIKYKM